MNSISTKEDLRQYWQSFYIEPHNANPDTQVSPIISGEGISSYPSDLVSPSQALKKTTQWLTQHLLNDNDLIAIFQGLLNVPSNTATPAELAPYLTVAGHILFQLSLKRDYLNISHEMIESVLSVTGKSGLRKMLRAICCSTKIDQNQLLEHIGLVPQDNLISRLLYARRHWSTPRFDTGSARSVLQSARSHRYSLYLVNWDIRPDMQEASDRLSKDDDLTTIRTLLQSKANALEGHNSEDPSKQHTTFPHALVILNEALSIVRFTRKTSHGIGKGAAAFWDIFYPALSSFLDDINNTEDFWTLLIHDEECLTRLEKVLPYEPDADGSVQPLAALQGRCTEMQLTLNKEKERIELSKDYITPISLYGMYQSFLSLFDSKDAGMERSESTDSLSSVNSSSER